MGEDFFISPRRFPEVWVIDLDQARKLFRILVTAQPGRSHRLVTDGTSLAWAR
jgi:hypothetical protein